MIMNYGRPQLSVPNPLDLSGPFIFSLGIRLAVLIFLCYCGDMKLMENGQ